MSIEIISPGVSSTLQDGGRYGFQDMGIPVSGFMDTRAAMLANLLVDNPKDTVLIEMTLLGIKFKAQENITIAITGANMQPKQNGKNVAMYKALEISKGDIVILSGAKTGVYGYLAVAGGFNVERDLGSKSTYLPAKLGGLEGRKLQKGDILPLNNKYLQQNISKLKPAEHKNKVKLDCLPGPEWDWFSQESKNTFFNTQFKVHQNSNRIGVRLEGAFVELPKRDEIISSGIVKGTVQITKGGQPIVMMADAPTTGGYLRMVNLTEQACNILAQVPVGGQVQFKRM
ncbi:5-oxoprolinase subunit C family protein [Wenyingzhuangia sp. IMCC45574]